MHLFGLRLPGCFGLHTVHPPGHHCDDHRDDHRGGPLVLHGHCYLALAISVTKGVCFFLTNLAYWSDFFLYLNEIYDYCIILNLEQNMTSLTSVPSCVLPSIVKRRVSRRSFAQIMNWAIGAIEVLSLIVFVGFAVDYCLHLSQSQILISPHQVEWAKSQIGISNQRILYIQTSANLICWR